MWLPFYFGGRASRGHTAFCPLIDFVRSYFIVPTRVAWRGWCACPSPGSPIGLRPLVSIWLISFHIYSKLCLAMREHGAEAFTIEAIKTVPYALRAQEEAITIAVRGTIGPKGLNLRLPKFRYLVPLLPLPLLLTSQGQ